MGALPGQQEAALPTGESRRPSLSSWLITPGAQFHLCQGCCPRGTSVGSGQREVTSASLGPEMPFGGTPVCYRALSSLEELCLTWGTSTLHSC